MEEHPFVVVAVVLLSDLFLTMAVPLPHLLVPYLLQLDDVVAGKQAARCTIVTVVFDGVDHLSQSKSQQNFLSGDFPPFSLHSLIHAHLRILFLIGWFCLAKTSITTGRGLQ